MDMECPDCRGSGSVMTRDTGVCGTEEYGMCRRCSGTGRVDRDTAPETLMRKVSEMERRLNDRKMADGEMILGILDEADKHRERFEAEAAGCGIRLKAHRGVDSPGRLTVSDTRTHDCTPSVADTSLGSCLFFASA